MLLGDLPHQTASHALKLARQHTGALLAWPQLPQRSPREQPLAQCAAGFPGLVHEADSGRIYVASDAAEPNLGTFELAYLENRSGIAHMNEQNAAGFYELLRQGDSIPQALAFKGQTLGPISLALQLTDDQGKPLIYQPAMFDRVTQFVRMRAAWQEQRLAELGRPTIICLDEPALELMGSPFLPIGWEDAAEQIGMAMEDVRGCRALFIGKGWEHMGWVKADLVIGSALGHADAMVDAAAQIIAHLQDDGLIGLGVIPHQPEPLAAATPQALRDQMSTLLGQLEQAGVAPRTLLEQAVITTAGGLGALTPPQAERALLLLAETSALLRDEFLA